MPSENNGTVYVLGAGFTRAFLPNAPLLVDDYGAGEILAKFNNLPRITRLLRLEMEKHSSGNIDIERLMTRLDGRMPYDFDQGANEELSLLLTEIKQRFRERFEAAKRGAFYSEKLKKLASHCLANKITCISFNYDDIFDQTLWELKTVRGAVEGTTYWHPDGGYGFFCQPSVTCIRNISIVMDRTAMFLLKLHGSMNWRLKRGYSMPYAIDAVVHHESWMPFYDDPQYKPEEMEPYLESEPFIVPPVLVKSSLVEQPILRLLWSLAFRTLEAATKVVFVGYSFPVTDLASNFLFSEAVKTREITVVNYARNNTDDKEIIKNAYRRIFPWLADRDFDFRGALAWSEEITSAASHP